MSVVKAALPPATLADLSRNTSVISTSSSDDDPLTHAHQRPLRYSSPPSGGHSRSPNSSRPPAYLARQLGYSENEDFASQVGQSDDAAAVESSASSANTSALSPPPTSMNGQKVNSAGQRSRSGPRNPGLTANDFHYGKTLGEGSFSRVVLGTHRKTGQKYAIKIIDKNYLIRMKKTETALAEKNALVQLGAGHPGIIRLYLSYQDQYSLYFVLDYIPNGDLHTLVNKFGSLSLECVRFYAAQIIDIIDYIHQKKVIHRDLKPENLLLDEKYRLKLTDFGTSKIIDETSDHRKSTFVGTPQYMSPELLETSVTAPSSDLWALGCILYRMISGKFAFNGLSDYLTMQKIKQLDYSFPDGFDDDVKDLVQKLLTSDPTQRLGTGLPGSKNSIQALRSHPFFASVNWHTLWTQDPPPLKAGMIKREHEELNGQVQPWDAIGEAWDNLVGDDEDDEDEIEWATDGKGPAYLMQRTKEILPPTEENVGPLEDIPRAMSLLSPIGENGVEQPPAPSPILLSGTKERPPSPQAIEKERSSTPRPASTPRAISPIQTADFNHIKQSAESTLSPQSDQASGNRTIDESPTTPTQRSSTKLPEDMSVETRGRPQVQSPVQGNLVQSNANFASLLRLSEGEKIIFSSPIEERTLRRRASRLLPPVVASAINKPRQLVLTNKRLFCVKQKRAGIVKIKSDLLLKSVSGTREGKVALKDIRAVISGVEGRGDREFSVMLASKSHTYATGSPVLASSWIQHIKSALSYNTTTSTTRLP